MTILVVIDGFISFSFNISFFCPKWFLLPGDALFGFTVGLMSQLSLAIPAMNIQRVFGHVFAVIFDETMFSIPGRTQSHPNNL